MLLLACPADGSIRPKLVELRILALTQVLYIRTLVINSDPVRDKDKYWPKQGCRHTSYVQERHIATDLDLLRVPWPVCARAHCARHDVCMRTNEYMRRMRFSYGAARGLLHAPAGCGGGAALVQWKDESRDCVRAVIDGWMDGSMEGGSL